jgi:hypothetical protein
MLIDNPQILRDVISETGAKPTHPGAETIVTALAGDLDKYSESLREHIKRVDEAKKSMPAAV